MNPYKAPKTRLPEAVITSSDERSFLLKEQSVVLLKEQVTLPRLCIYYGTAEDLHERTIEIKSPPRNFNINALALFIGLTAITFAAFHIVKAAEILEPHLINRLFAVLAPSVIVLSLLVMNIISARKFRKSSVTYYYSSRYMKTYKLMQCMVSFFIGLTIHLMFDSVYTYLVLGIFLILGVVSKPANLTSESQLLENPTARGFGQKFLKSLSLSDSAVD